VNENERDDFFTKLFETEKHVVRAAAKAGLGDEMRKVDFEGCLDDVVQDAWVTIYAALLKFEHRTPGQTRAWLRLLARRAGAEARKRYFRRLATVTRYKNDLAPKMLNSYALTAEDLAETATQKRESDEEE
jgi:DNA-directed RNA polymerase specialized sigma24 family protein